MIALRREVNACSLTATRVLELPKFVSSSKGSYWHIPRSAIRHEDERLSVQAWCGITLGTRPLRFSDVAPVDRICGTCSGRFDGVRAGNPLIFTPRDEFAPPKWCPGGDCDEHRNCVACGERVRTAYGWWSSGIAQHRPGPGLAVRCRPCPDHGWSRPSFRDGRIVCTFEVGFGWGACAFDMGPERR